MSTNKVIVTNASSLTTKYGKAGYEKITAALKLMTKADAKRGLLTRIVALDSKTDMAAYGVAPCQPGDAATTKKAIDAIHARERPDYILILGAGDVVPLVPLKNPVYVPGGDDDDRVVPSDLPYACDTAYSLDINRFVGPTRVVGRLPDMVGAKNPQYLLKLLRLARNYKARAPADYQKYFGLSAQKWQASTGLSLSKLFGNSSGLNTAPPSGPKWAAGQLAPRAHFINCHGGHRDTHYYGQALRKEEYPVAHSAELLTRKIVSGTILAVECCYGAELYDPAKTGGQAGIAYTYLDEGAYGVFGSTTIAYGPSSGNSSADLICQYFLQAVMNGASLGRAALEARQQFAGLYSHLSPVDLKTLAQFYLLGDPSIHAVAAQPHGLNKTKTFKSAFAQSGDAGPRTLRRERLQRIGKGLHKDMPATRQAGSGSNTKPSREISVVLENAARESGLGEHLNMHFHVAPKTRLAAKEGTKRTVHMLVSTKAGKAAQSKSGKREIVVIMATAENGKLMHLRRLHSR